MNRTGYTQNCAYRDKGYAASEGNGEATDSIRRHQDERFPIKKRNGHSFQPAEIKRRIKKQSAAFKKLIQQAINRFFVRKIQIRSHVTKIIGRTPLSTLTIKNFLVLE